MAAAEEDWVVRFLREFASMSEEERDAAIEALSSEGRGALVTLAEQRGVTAATDLTRVLDAGQGGLDKLYEVSEPADLFTVINLAVRGQPNLVVEALFAAVVLHRGWDEEQPAAIVALREQWHWHVYEQIRGAREHEGDHQDAGAD
jgi:hypothetical protein